ncbi:MAG TPA: RsmE family RNA methyltransferase [Acidimicrobiia bacterium]|nr:RsmE family RNA methyltransferase [Acidimicrobiia bacterium]
MADAAPGWAAAHPATAHVFLGALTDTARVTGDDGHHLARVRRVRAGEELTAADGSGTWRPYVVARVEGAALELAACGEPCVEPELTPRLEVAFALTKGAKPETVVQQLTELGVDRIRPVRARRSVVRWDAARAEAALARLRRVAREAAMQCRRARLPAVDPPAELATLAGVDGLVIGDPAAVGAPPPEPPAGGVWVAVVGPEGGFEPGETACLGPAARLAVGPHVLRAETAAVSVAAALAVRRRIGHP